MTPAPLAERSRLAGWSAYLAALSVPVLIIAAVGHRQRLIEAVPTYAVMALGFCLAALAVIAALAALVTVWRDGRKGLGAALRGLALGLVVLSIPAVAAWDLVQYPRLTDVSTDLVNPPRFTHATADRRPGDVPPTGPGADQAALQQQAYPDIVPRHYPVSTARVFDEIKALVAKRGWQVLDSRPPSELDPGGSLEAVATTLIFGFRQDVAIRVEPDGDGSRVDMRSAARNGAHDLGADAERIRRLFADLDGALAGVAGQ